ncbi:PAS domain-containing sensor histidine kinase [Aureimonas sp. ME7]|uniref:cell cycle histidine kinase CckA n=1 Tax=Aureimonas sp. ME7 TaxID=2744252 RepID=UPI0015F67475|nr:PAS domain-containing sensor histidine kinase [Aureimonas sp. ME7]
MSDKPLIDGHFDGGGVRRLLFLAGFVFVFAATLALLGHSYGAIALLAIFGILAMFGIVAIFGLALGFLRFGARESDANVAREALNALPTGMLVTDRRGRIVYANRAYGEETGASGSSGVRSLERLLSREPEASEAIYRLANLARENRMGQEEFRLTRKLGGAGPSAPHWYRASVSPFGAEADGLQLWQISDVTPEREEQESFFKDLQHAIDYLDHAPAGFFASDTSGRLAYINATLADWLSLDLAAFKPYAHSISDHLSEESAAVLRRAQSTAVSGEVQTVDLDLVTAAGQRLPVRLLRNATAGTDGALGLSRTLVLNRSPQGNDENALRDAEVRFTRFFNSSPMAIAAIDAAGHVTRANPAFAALFGEETAMGRSLVSSGVRDENREAIRQALGSALRGQAGIPSVDAELTTEPVRSVRLYFSANADVGDGSGEVVILYGVDITQQRTLEDQFAKAQRMQAIGNLAGGIAHDFNNVLTIITASVDFLLLNHRTGDPSFQDLLLIKQSANRAASLVRQLLAYSRRQTMRPKMLNLTDVIADMHLLLKRISGDLVKLERQHARDLWPVMADIGQFEQVVTNLVQNARDAMSTNGRVTIATRNVPADEAARFGYSELGEGDYVLMEVSDTGSGMPADVAERIFEPFFTTKEIGKGTGLGLSMAYGIIKQSGGSIFVESKLGEGTTFRIFLPRHIPAETAVVKGETPSAAASNAKLDLSGTASILLVEDEDNVRAGNVRALKMRGYEVHEASSGVEALDVMEELDGRIDLVVSDVVMPEMDGPTLLREMRKQRPELKFIFVSGYAEDAFAKNLPEGEKFGFLPKPFSLRELAVAVKEALEE